MKPLYLRIKEMSLAERLQLLQSLREQHNQLKAKSRQKRRNPFLFLSRKKRNLLHQ